MKLQVDVTPDDILYGKKRCVGRCALAMAFGRLVSCRLAVYPDLSREGGELVWVAELLEEGLDGRIILPDDAGRFAEKFDAGEDVGPISFEVEAGEKVRKWLRD